jgi:hypothetical protein
MDFMLVCYNDEKHWATLPQSEQDRIVTECVAYAGDLKREGFLRASGRLRETATATTIRGSDHGGVVMDGPFAETKEVLAGYYIVRCRDHAEAVALANRNPKLKHAGGSIEVRPLIADA